jgi:hypothetical protein
VIVITGPGRSGTSLLARLYQELGFDPVEGGGGWEEPIRGGLEDIEVGRLNLEIIRALKMQARPSPLADRAKRLLDRRPPGGGREATEGGGALGAPSLRIAVLQRTIGRRIRLQSWDDLDAVAERFGEQLRELAARRAVVKDPQFCQTLAVWAAAKAPIEQVVISLRETTATAQGLLELGHLPAWARQSAPNHVAYRVGLLMTAVVDHRLPHVVVRFPDFLHEAESLYDSLCFPAPVDRERFLEVFAALVNPGLVHNWR